MYKLYYAFLLCGVLSQISALVINDGTDEYTQLINDRIRNLDISIGLAKKSMGLTYGVIDNNIKEAIQDLSGKIVNLEDLVSETETKAEDDNVDITECVNAQRTNIAVLDLTKLQTCRSAPEMTSVIMNIPNLGILKSGIRRAIPQCSRLNPDDPTAVKSCIDEKLNNLDSQINEINNEIKNLLNQAVPSSQKCIDNAKEELESILNDTDAAFRDCLNNLA